MVFGVFLAHYLDTNTFPGASDLDYAFVGGLSLSMAQFIAPVATITTRMWCTRVTLMIGITLQTAALLGASWAGQIWQLFLSQALCFGFGMGMQFSATVGIIPQWFTRRRSLANGIATAGSGIGGLIYSLATSAMIQRWGIGWAFRILAVVSAAACGFSAIIVRDRKKAIGAVQIAFHTELLRRPDFLLTLAWGCFGVLGYVALLFSIPDYATTVGLTASQGSIVGAMFNLGGGLGRPVIGYVSDSFGRLNTALACTFLAGLFSLVIWVFAKDFGVLIYYALISGPFAATFTTTVAPVGAEVMGLQLLPSALSIFWLSVVIPSTFAEPIALWLRTDNGTNFLHAQIFVGFMSMAACICLGLVRAWKISALSSSDADGDPLKQETQIRDDDAVPRESVVGTASSVPSITSKAKIVKGLFTMARV
ncbi:MFS transporter [Aspergillus tubingensis]|uniref:MFS transporter n=1 Tax=Aspergillus tubingensis TaxID=5068 RepID=UPI0015781EBB|nr:MFS transporter [Aspergillus tubingensis]GFN10378.1 MFS transporter [Aspergillus tubingensis]